MASASHHFILVVTSQPTSYIRWVVALLFRALMTLLAYFFHFTPTNLPLSKGNSSIQAKKSCMQEYYQYSLNNTSSVLYKDMMVSQNAIIPSIRFIRDPAPLLLFYHLLLMFSHHRRCLVLQTLQKQHSDQQLPLLLLFSCYLLL